MGQKFGFNNHSKVENGIHPRQLVGLHGLGHLAR